MIGRGGEGGGEGGERMQREEEWKEEGRKIEVGG